MGSLANRQELIADLQRVAHGLGYAPLTSEYDRLGNFSTITIRKHLGSWKDALMIAGLTITPSHRDRWSDRDLHDEVQRVSNLVGHSPSWTEFKQHSNISTDTLNRRLGRSLYIKDAPLLLTEDWSIGKIEPEIGAWIAGLTTGEGTFIIRRNLVTFGLCLRADDREILEFIKCIMDIPNPVLILSNQTRRNKGQLAGDEARLITCNKPAIIFRVIPFFDRFELRGRKKLDFQLFREASFFLYQRQLNGKFHARFSDDEKNFMDSIVASLKKLRHDPTSIL